MSSLTQSAQSCYKNELKARFQSGNHASVGQATSSGPEWSAQVAANENRNLSPSPAGAARGGRGVFCFEELLFRTRGTNRLGRSCDAVENKSVQSSPNPDRKTNHSFVRTCMNYFFRTHIQHETNIMFCTIFSPWPSVLGFVEYCDKAANIVFSCSCVSDLR